MDVYEGVFVDVIEEVFVVEYVLVVGLVRGGA